MELRRIWPLVAIPFALVACGAEEEPATDVTVEPAPVAAPTAGMDTMGMGAGGGMASTVNMQAMNNSGVTGQATVTPANGQTQVMVQLNAAAGGSTHPGHIHQGTCDSPGSVVEPLQPITLDNAGAGNMTTTVGVDPMTVMNGQHIIQYHGEGGTPVACGSIPQHTM